MLRKPHCNMHKKNGPKVGGELLLVFHNKNCLEYPIVICIHYVANLLQKSGPKVGGGFLWAFSQYKLLRISHCNMHTLCSKFAPKKWSESRGGTFISLFTV